MQPAVQDFRETPSKGRFALALSSSKEVRVKDFLVSLSIANLCFLYVWIQIGSLAGEHETRYYATHAPLIGYLWALIFDILVLATFVFFARLLCRASAPYIRWPALAILVFCCLYALYDVQRCFTPVFELFFTYRGQTVAKVLLVTAGFLWLVKSRERALQTARAAFLIVSPLFLVLSIDSIWNYSHNALRTIGKGTAAGMLSARPARPNRVIWIIFDELDDRLLFQARPARIHLAEFDRLRQESIYAAHVRTPATSTLDSVPSMFLGETITEARPDTATLLIKTKDNPRWRNFQSEPNVFRRARAQGFNTGLSGWHHPYCRILGGDLSECSWENGGWTNNFVERDLRRSSFLTRAVYLARWQAELFRGYGDFRAPNIVALYRESNVEAARYVTENAERMLADQKLNLVFLHFPVPHPPGIWDTSHARFTTANSNYIDNLQLSDYLLGKLRRNLEATGDWDRSTILVSGDHPYRATMWQGIKNQRSPEMVTATRLQDYPYVPFLLKLPSQKQGLSYDRAFNSVLSSDLVSELLDGRISKTTEAVSWLNEHAEASLTNAGW